VLFKLSVYSLLLIKYKYELIYIKIVILNRSWLSLRATEGGVAISLRINLATEESLF
ncbi:unnamed protein product, partial [marine sediment metagenome]